VINMGKDENLDKILNRIDALCEKRPSHKEVLKFLKQVITEQSKIKPEIKIDSIDINENIAKIKCKEGFPLVSKEDIRFDVDLATTLFKRLCEILNERVSEDIKKINKAIDGQELDLEELFKKALPENGNHIKAVAQNLGLNQFLLSFLAKNTLKPFFEAYANELKEYVDQEHWLKNYCPVCGSEPFMAELSEKEGKRFLICSSCGYKWRFVRIRCPYCNNNNHKTLRYFYTEKEGRAYRVDVCDKCKRYIKTIDTNELGEEVIPAIEDVGTMYLDLLAEKQGYKRDEKTLF